MKRALQIACALIRLLAVAVGCNALTGINDLPQKPGLSDASADGRAEFDSGIRACADSSDPTRRANGSLCGYAVRTNFDQTCLSSAWSPIIGTSPSTSAPAEIRLDSTGAQLASRSGLISTLKLPLTATSSTRIFGSFKINTGSAVQRVRIYSRMGTTLLADGRPEGLFCQIEIVAGTKMSVEVVGSNGPNWRPTAAGQKSNLNVAATSEEFLFDVLDSKNQITCTVRTLATGFPTKALASAEALVDAPGTSSVGIFEQADGLDAQASIELRSLAVEHGVPVRPAHHWPMNEPAGKVAFDLGDSPTDGRLSSLANFATVADTRALVLGDTSNAALTTISFKANSTIAFRVSESAGGQQQSATILGSSRYGDSLISNVPRLVLGINNESTPRSFVVDYKKDASEKAFIQREFAPAALVGKWRHAAIVLANPGVELYIDAQVTTVSLPNSDIRPTAMYTSSTNFHAGGSQSNGLENKLFVGALADIRLYDRALTQCELAIISY